MRSREGIWNFVARRCGFNSEECLFVSQGNGIKQNSKSTFSLFFFFFVRNWEVVVCSSGIEVFLVVLDIFAFKTVIKCHHNAIMTFQLFFNFQTSWHCFISNFQTLPQYNITIVTFFSFLFSNPCTMQCHWYCGILFFSWFSNCVSLVLGKWLGLHLGSD